MKKGYICRAQQDEVEVLANMQSEGREDEFRNESHVSYVNRLIYK